jgi:hypothetical protein
MMAVMACGSGKRSAEICNPSVTDVDLQCKVMMAMAADLASRRKPSLTTHRSIPDSL